MRKQYYCICETKGADQLCSDCTADQHLCFRYTDSTIPPLLIFEISSFKPFSVAVQVSLCLTWSEILKLGFLTSWLNIKIKHLVQCSYMQISVCAMSQDNLSSAFLTTKQGENKIMATDF